MNKNNIRVNFSWNFFGSLIYSATQWAMIIILTRIGSVEIVGLFSLGLAITAPIMMLTNLQLTIIQTTLNNKSYNFSDFLAVRIISNFVFLAILIIILGIGNYGYYTIEIIILVAVTKIVESFSDIIYGQFQYFERMEYTSQSKIIRGMLSLITVALVLYISDNFTFSLMAWILIWLWVLYFFDMKNLFKFGIKFRPNFNKRNIFDIVKIALPLGILVMIVSLNINFPRILIEREMNTEMLGYFVSIFYLVYIAGRFINSLGGAVLPRLARLHEQNNFMKFDKILYTLLLICVATGLIAIIISIIWGDILLHIIYGSDFVDFQHILIYVMIFGLLDFSSYVLITGLNAIKSYRVQPYLGAIWLIITLISSLVLIPMHGLIGAAFTLIIYGLTRVTTLTVVFIISLKKQRNYKSKQIME